MVVVVVFILVILPGLFAEKGSGSGGVSLPAKSAVHVGDLKNGSDGGVEFMETLSRRRIVRNVHASVIRGMK